MGIRGLPAFIKSKAKDCIRDFKLQDLHSRAVAIDGNIVTQRFHHSTESEHPNRTILGWYRFIKHLKSYAITPIVVFDGSRRVSAKARELERRLNARKLLAGRAESEGARAARLQELKDITTTLQSLDRHERSRTLEETQKLLDSARLEDVPAEAVTADDTQAIPDLEDVEVSSERQVMVEDKRPKIIEEITPDKTTTAETADDTGAVQQIKDEEVTVEREELAQEEVPEVREETPDKTTTVYLDPTLAPATAPLSARFAQLTLAMQATAISEAPTLSKRQHAIAQAEAKAFTQALMPVEQSESDSEAAEEEEDPLQVLQAALHESSLISEEYERRSQPIRKETYTDCMDVLRAMGVPVLLTSSTEPQEAESVCASLVEAGHADLVMTEDTDVLVFDAPMLRRVGMTSREGELLHGREIREALGFKSREQWVDFCLLCGCDFIERIRGIGPVKAYKYILEYGSIEAILESGVLEKHKSVIPPPDPASYLMDIEAARAIFLTPMPVGIVTKEELQLQDENPNMKSIMRGFGLNVDRISATLEGNEQEYLGVDMEEAFGLANFDKPPLTIRA